MSAAKTLALALGSAFCLLAPAFADTLYLKVKDIKGSVSEFPYKDWSYGNSFQHSLARSISTRREGGSPQWSDLTVTKLLDASSPFLFGEATVGKGRDVELELVRNTPARERYFRIKLRDALVSNYSVSSSDALPMESISFNYMRIDFTYTDYSKDGGSPESTTAWYDIPQGTGGIQSSTSSNSTPTISPIAGQTTPQDTPLTVAFTVNDLETPASNLTVTASSDNQTLVPDANLTPGGSGANRTLTIQPAAGRFGQANITVRVYDSSLTAARSFLLIVDQADVNDPPAIIVSDQSAIDVIAGRDTPITRLQTMDPETNQLSLTLEVVNGILRAGTSAGVTISGNDSSQLVLSGLPAALNALLASSSGLAYRASAGVSGTDVLTATLSDGSHSVLASLNIRVYRTQYEQWLHQQFSEAELNDPALEASLWGVHADADGDRLENLAEYALGHDVSKSDPISVAIDPRLSLTLKRRQDPDLSIEVEIASELDSNSWSSDPSVLEAFPPVDLGNGFDELRFMDRQPVTAAGKRFMRVRWTLNP